MPDDFFNASHLDGVWEGYYDHDNKLYSTKNFPITATIEQQGRSLRGIMIDGVTDFRQLYRKIVESHEGRMSAFAEDEAWMVVESYPDGLIESSLPEESRLDGRIHGGTIRFVKTYLGEHSIYGIFGSRRVLIRRIVGHRVHYQGALSQDARTIEGAWTIRKPGLFSRFLPPASSGRFQLFRKS